MRIKPRKPWMDFEDHSIDSSNKSKKHTCETCLAKFVAKHNRKPTCNEKPFLGTANKGCECENCYNESLYAFAEVKPAKNYQTITQALWDVLRGFN